MTCACFCSCAGFLSQNPFERLYFDVIWNVGNGDRFHGIFEYEVDLSALDIVERVLVCEREPAVILDDPCHVEEGRI